MMASIDYPSNWKRKPVKYVATWNDETLPENTDEHKEFDYLEISGVSLKGGIDETNRMSFFASPSRARRKVQSGDILISTVRTYLKAITYIEKASEDLIASTGFCVIRPSGEIDSAFLGWVVKSEPFVSEVMARSVGVSYPAINAGELVTIEVPLPPIETQRCIAVFLDEKTARIDELIEKKQALFDRLDEKRQALITRTVTKGLTEDKLCDDGGIPSGLGWKRLNLQFVSVLDSISLDTRDDEQPDWAVYIPENWRSDLLKWCVQLSTERPTIDEQDSLPYISNEDISSWTGKLLTDEPQPSESEGRKFQGDDVLFNKLRPYLAKVYHACFDGVSSGELLCLRPSVEVIPRFLFYVLTSKCFIDTINAESFGAKMPRADWEIVGHLPLPLPSIDTQHQIVGFLDEKTAQTEELVEKILLSIELLDKYRSALITAAVTGQTQGLV